MRFNPYPAATDAWEFAGERWTIMMIQRLPVGDAVGGLSVDSTYDDGWATLRHIDGSERVISIPELIEDGKVISGTSVKEPILESHAQDRERLEEVEDEIDQLRKELYNIRKAVYNLGYGRGLKDEIWAEINRLMGDWHP